MEKKKKKEIVSKLIRVRQYFILYTSHSSSRSCRSDLSEIHVIGMQRCFRTESCRSLSLTLDWILKWLLSSVVIALKILT